MCVKFLNYLFVITLLVSVSCSNHQADKPKNDLDQWKLRGPVKVVTETNFAESGKYLTIVTFTKDGNVLEQSSFNPDGSLIRKWKYNYNSQNQKQKRYCYVLHDSLSYIFNYYYNTQGNLIATRISNRDTTSQLRTSIYYDGYQNNIEENSFGPKLNLELQIKHQYDNHHRVIEEVFVDSVNHHQWKQIHSYHVNGNDEEIADFSFKNDFLKRETFIYSRKNLPLVVCSYDPDNRLVSKISYKYNKLGDVTEIIKSKTSDNQHEIKLFKYTYDKNGNWTFLSEYNNQKLESLMTRKLEYFK